MIRRVVGWGLVLLVVVAVVVSGRAVVLKRRALAAAPSWEGRALPVRVVPAVRGDLAVVRRLTAVAEALRRVEVSARPTAVVTSVAVDEGDLVDAGAVLVGLDARDARARLEAERASLIRLDAEEAGVLARVGSLERSLDFWRREAGRDRVLAASGDVPRSQAEATAERLTDVEGRLSAARSERDALHARRDGARALVAAAAAALDDTVLRAPFDGVVTTRFADPGTLARPGVPLVVVESSELVLRADVAQDDLPAVGAGSVLRLPDPGGTIVVTRVTPALDASRRGRIEAGPEGVPAGLVSGASIPVELVLETLRDVVVVPAAALVADQGWSVFVVVDGRLQRRSVALRGRGADEAAVTGVEAGEDVVVSPWMAWSALADGLTVEVVR